MHNMIHCRHIVAVRQQALAYLWILFMGILGCSAGVASSIDEDIPPTESQLTPVERSSKGDLPQPLTQARALLVGVSRYPNLPPGLHLEGPDNDVKMLSVLLKERFGIPEGNVVVLSESAGPDFLPTRARIEQAFADLAKQAQQGEQVFILIAGHGSQQPDQDGDERDGLDEIFLPRDVGTWNGQKGSIENAIVDDELGVWLQAIRDKGARIFFIADTCHSGTISRGDSAIARNVRAADLGIPADAIAAAVERASQTARGGPAANTNPESSSSVDISAADKTTEGGFIALYAAHPHELTYEEVLPKKSGQRHGWLSWALGKALSESAENRLTYRELVQRVHWHYQQQPWTSSHPFVEASESELDREVLGVTQWPGRSRIQLQRLGNGEYTINAGSLQQVSLGSVLAVYPDGQEEPAGFVKVTRVSPLRSIVQPIEFDGSPLATELPIPARCEFKYRDLGEFQVWVAIDVTMVKDSTRQSSLREQLTKVLKEAAEQPEAMLRLAPEGETPDWFVVASPDGLQISLVSHEDMRRDAAGVPLLEDASPFGPYSVGDRLGATLFNEFGKIARAWNLRRMAELEMGAAEGIRLDVRVERVVDNRRMQYSPLNGGTPTLYDKDLLRIIVSNPSKSYVDVTVLYIQSDGEIACFFPRAMDLNRLGPDESHTISGIRINVDTIGLEDLIVIGVPAAEGAVPASFAYLQQPSLQRNPGEQRSPGELTPRGENPAWTTPLGLLTRSRMFNTPGLSRGITVERDSFVIQRISWNIVKAAE